MSFGPCTGPLLDALCVTGAASSTVVNTVTSTASPTITPSMSAPVLTITGVYLFIIPTVLAIFAAAGFAVLLRVVVQRRRRRQLQEAIAAGILLPEQLVALGYTPYVMEQPVPTMWEASLDKKGNGSEDLQGVLPLSATVIRDESPTPPAVNSSHALGRVFRRLIRRNRPSTASLQPTALPDHLQVTFLVSLPSAPQESKAKDPREGELGEVVFGTIEFPWNDSHEKEFS